MIIILSRGQFVKNSCYLCIVGEFCILYLVRIVMEEAFELNFPKLFTCLTYKIRYLLS